MALTDKLTNIADAIRKKTGKTDSLTLDDMVTEIGSLTLESLLNPADYPQYVKDEVLRVVNKIHNDIPKFTNDMLISICMSDSHYYPDNNTKNGVLHGLMGMKALTYLLPIDFIAHLGDVGYEGPSASTSTTDKLKSNLLEILPMVAETTDKKIPLFVAIGNHDTGIYITEDDYTDWVDGSWLYEHFTDLAPSTAIKKRADDIGGGYCYYDFFDKKIRLFLLNSCENINGNQKMSQAQQDWFKESLNNLNALDDAASWGYMVLCHFPGDYGHMATSLANIIYEYQQDINFKPKFLVQYHGHIHNFLYRQLIRNTRTNNDYIADRVGFEKIDQMFNAYRVAIPNAQYNRENYYYANNGSESALYDPSLSDGTLWGARFYEGEYNLTSINKSDCTKIPDTAQDTAFVVNILDKNNMKLYSYYYGAGIDGYGTEKNRIIDLTGEYWSIVNNLTNVSVSNLTTQIKKGESFTTTLTWEDNYNLDSITITMGGVDITDQVYANKTITISSVTGNVTITAAAYKLPTTNLGRIAYSFEPNSTEIYNGIGYKDNTRLSGSAPTSWETSQAGYVLTGCIPWDKQTPIVISGAELDSNGTAMMFVTNTQRNHVYHPWISSYSLFEQYFNIERSNGTTTLTLKSKNTWPSADANCFAITLKGTGRDLIIKCGGITEDDGYTITNNLTNISTNNSAQTVTENTKYEATLTPNEGYIISSVQVMMGGQIVANAYDNSTNKITIESVTGNIVITASGTLKTYSINNILTQVTNSNGSTEIIHGSSYTATLSPSTGHKISSVSVKMNGVDITSTVYNNSTINIDLVNGNIEITAVAIVADYTVSYSLANVNSTSNITALTYGSSYTTKLISDNNYIIDSVRVTMGGVTVAPTVITAGQEYEINIASVTGDIEITAIASVYNWLPLATEDVTQDSAIYGTNGFKTDTNLSSTSGAERPKAGYCLTGYIPVHHGDTVILKNIEFYGNDTYDMVAFYCDTYTNNYGTHHKGSFQNAISVGKLIPIDGGYTFVVDIGTGDYNTAITHMRICAKTITNQTVIQITNKQ